MTLSEGFSFTKGLPVLKIPFRKLPGQADYPSMLFDLEQDPAQETLCHEEDAKKRMEQLMRNRMIENDCPPELLVRYGL